ncbi:MAG: WG repeat-containing protein [Bacteroidales bacterium]|nr:WG repeat-containing protein [Bacteroidales bacterium]
MHSLFKYILLTSVLLLFQINLHAQNAKPFESEGLWGVRSGDGENILEARWMMVFPDFEGNFYGVYEEFEEKRFVFVKNGYKTGTWKYYDRKEYISDHVLVTKDTDMEHQYQMYNLLTGRRIGRKFYNIKPFSEGLAAVNTADWREPVFGYVNKEGRVVIDGKFSDAQPFNEGLAAVRKEFKQYYGFIDRSGNMVIPDKYGSAGNFKDGCAIVDKSYGDIGLIGPSNEVLLPFVFDKIRRIEDKLIVMQAGHKHGLFNIERRQTIIPCEYSYPEKFERGYWQVSKGNLKGIYANNGQQVLPCEFDNISLRKIDDVFLVEKRRRQGCYDLSGRRLIPAEYDSIFPYDNGYARIMRNGYMGMADRQGHIVVKPQYDDVFKGEDHFFPVKKDGRYGFVKNGELFISLDYDDFNGMEEGLAAMSYKGKWGFVNTKGRESIPFRYDKLRALSGGLAAAKKGGQWGFIDKNGNTHIEFSFDSALDFLNGHAFGKQNGTWFILNKNGSRQSTPYSEVIPFDEHGYIVAQNGKYGFINKQYNEVLPCRYKGIYHYTDGMLKITKGGGSGLYNYESNKIIEPKYHTIFPVRDGLIKVKTAASTGYFDRQGNGLILMPYDDINRQDVKEMFTRRSGLKGIIRVTKNGRMGCINQNGTLIIPVEYHDIQLTGFKNMIIVKKKGLYGMFDSQGNEVLPVVFDNISYNSDSGLLQANYRNVKIELQGNTIWFDIKN